MVHQTSNSYIPAVMHNLKFIILDYLAAKKSGIYASFSDFYDWSINSSSIWKVMPMSSWHYTVHNPLNDSPLH